MPPDLNSSLVRSAPVRIGAHLDEPVGGGLGLLARTRIEAASGVGRLGLGSHNRRSGVHPT